MSDLGPHGGVLPPRDWRHTRTDRLWLDVAVDSDIDDLHRIHADPATWTHFPSGWHTSRECTGVGTPPRWLGTRSPSPTTSPPTGR